MSEETVEKLASLFVDRNAPGVRALVDVLEQLLQLPEDEIGWRLVIFPPVKKHEQENLLPKRTNFEKGWLHCEQCKQDFEVFVEREHDPEVCPLCGSDAWYLPF